MEQIIEQYGEYLYHFSYLYVKDIQLAEEITQDVLMKFLLHKEDFRNDASIKTYLTRIAINCCHDELRKQKRKNLLTKLLPVRKNEPSSEQKYLAIESFTTLKDSVFALPVYYREVIILFYYEEFEVAEIADLLKISQNTVRTRIRRARELLKNNQELEAAFYDGI
ncbi:sigma-70 family RNA polymerase sigma factor [Solibacillus sp. MA9]|uniref:Sigma-70 family RNA polymerase sigma factor n=1 Tax=Solibacillus palustris TaxID=2908203 RepID=A0ABS9UDQ4_9BACL|nr:sigma-70 family RNA polymerase sigma factor [Solibacillus sp. MA9]